ncbi:DUF4232 domain-containing protein [Streptomyces sp. SID5785]|uniref:DUF4232 domain-containing protein n=1 Tax=Streptomyces sp. SID5785 TaxID=2690309 RepID=UPI001361B7FB|nr:DUF4232 domain-containing protein [Streptomyces sp. SID5785]MZD08910.1 DUF4232 domain-containing protein [Streptomyces sp. SID5785]
MTRNRTARSRLLLTAATVAVAALSLTACDDGSGVKDEGASLAPSATAPGTARPGSTDGKGGAEGDKTPASARGNAGGDTNGTANGTGTGAAGRGGRSAGGTAVTCDGNTTKTVAAPLTRPVNHMLITVTNTGSRTCYLYGYPAVRFGEAQSVPPVIADSKPQAVVTLSPGESGYSSVKLSAADGSGTNGTTAKDLTVYFQGHDGEGLTAGAHPSVPAKGVYVDSTLEVTYWQQSMDDALSW